MNGPTTWMAIFAMLLGAACGGSSSAGSSSSGGAGGGGATGSNSSTTSSTTSSSAASGATGGGDAGMPPRRVFGTSDTHAGALGGLTGGDAVCQGLADKAGLGGTWLVWLGDGTSSPFTRFTRSAAPYVVVGGPQIAANWDDLVDSSLAAPIDHDETGASLPANGVTAVKSGTFSSGKTAPLNCLAWTSGGANDYSLAGSLTAVDQNWTMSVGLPCAELDRLYCFEQ